jgi:hypothetical protein
MKKILGVFLTALLVVGMSAPSFAAKGHKQAKKFDRIVAQVVSVDAAAKTMVVKEEKTGESKTITISAKAASQVKAGDRVRIKLKPGTEQSMGVRVLKDKSQADVAPAASPEAAPAAEAPAAPVAK